MTILEMVRDILEFFASQYMNERVVLTYRTTPEQENTITKHFERFFDDDDIREHQTEYASIVELSRCADVRKSGNDIFSIFRGVYFRILLYHGDEKDKLKIYNSLSKHIESIMNSAIPTIGFSPSLSSIFGRYIRTSRMAVENALHRHAAISRIVKETHVTKFPYKPFHYAIINTSSVHRYLSSDTINELFEFVRHMFYAPLEFAENPEFKTLHQKKWILYYAINGRNFPDDEKHPMYYLIFELIRLGNNCCYSEIDRALETYASAMKYYGKSSMSERRDKND